MLKFTFIIMFSLLSAGCATVKFNGPDTTITKIDHPKIGKIVTAYVGDEMVAKGKVYETNVLIVHGLVKGFSYDVPPKKYEQIGFDDQDEFYSASGIIRAAFTDPVKAISVGKAPGSKICIITVYSMKTCYAGAYSRARHAVEYSDSFQQTLIYSGRIGSKLNISYREFSNNRARPAFSNDVEYDFLTSNIIGYKGAQLEIINADNSSITYRLISNFR